jgi:DnaJ-class molecular chaperone with C-terminal Zn finger domain
MVATRTNDPYAILGVDRSAGDQAIAAARRRLARTYHPDVAGEAASGQMMRVNAAYDRIRDRRRRAAYAVEEAEDRGIVADSRGGTPARQEDTRSGPAATGLDWAPRRDGTGGAGPPPGRPSGSVLPFGRHIGWSVGEVARADPGYLVWLEDRREGRPHVDEIDRVLRYVGFRRADDPRPVQGARFRR